MINKIKEMKRIKNIMKFIIFLMTYTTFIGIFLMLLYAHIDLIAVMHSGKLVFISGISLLLFVTLIPSILIAHIATELMTR